MAKSRVCMREREREIHSEGLHFFWFSMEVAGAMLRHIRTKPRKSYDTIVDAGGLVQHNNGDLSDDDDDGVCAIDEPVTPAGRAFLNPLLNTHILVILGSKTPIIIDALKSGLRDTLVKHKRFSSVIRKSDKGELYWVPTSINLDEHIVIPGGGDTSSPTFVEDYVVQLGHAPRLDTSRPLFEFHILRAKLGDAVENVVFRVHHALGDGTSLMSLLLACTRQVNEPNFLPTLPTQVYRRREKSSVFKIFFLRLWNFLFILWYTFLDVCLFMATMLWLEDSQTPLKGTPGVEKLSRRLAHRMVSMDDIRTVKQAIHG